MHLIEKHPYAVTN